MQRQRDQDANGAKRPPRAPRGRLVLAWLEGDDPDEGLLRAALALGAQTLEADSPKRLRQAVEPWGPKRFLYYHERRLALSETQGETAVSADFCSERLKARSRRARLEAAPKAAGATRLAELWDATAGLGVDSFLFASCGARVTLFERDPAVFLLLLDARARALSDPETRAAASRMRPVFGSIEDLEPCALVGGEAGAYRFVPSGPHFFAPAAQSAADAPNALSARGALGALNAAGGAGGAETFAAPPSIYLDPMFDAGKKGKAAAKKGMEALREWLGPQGDPSALLRAARLIASRRVAVKRPVKAPFVGGEKPNHSLQGKTARFDVYLPLARPPFAK